MWGRDWMITTVYISINNPLPSSHRYYSREYTSLSGQLNPKAMDNSLSIFDIEGITDDVNRINSSCQDARMRFLFKSLVTHLHSFVRETHLSTKEWEQAIKFLTDVGHMTSEVRQEFILLSDILGVSVLVDAIDHPKPPGATEGTILGPFHTHEAQQCHNGASISQDNEGQEMFVVCSVKDTQGQPIAGVKIDVWETNSKGFYDVQYHEREGPDGRAILTSDENGIFHFKAVVPASYPIPTDGLVGQLLTKLNRHPYRPSHIHFMFDKVGYDRLITSVILSFS